MLKRKSRFMVAVLCAVSAMGLMGQVNAEEGASASTSEGMMTHMLAGITVEGDQDVLPGGFMAAQNRVGILGNVETIDVPFSQRNYTEKTLTTFYDPNQPMNGVLANNPSIRVGSPSPMYTDFSMRGINMNASHYSINGVPDMFSQSRTMPMYVLESVDIISGPNTVLNGAVNSNNGTDSTSAPPGLLNGVTKKATAEPITRYTWMFSGDSTWTEMIDMGRRFGKNNEWGIRVNAMNRDGALSIKGAEEEEKSIYFNLDHTTEKSTTNLFGGYFDWVIYGGQRWLQASGVEAGHLPGAPSARTNLSFDGAAKYSHGFLFVLNHTQKLDDAWSVFFNSGYTNYQEHKYDAASGSLTFNNDGILTGTFRNYKSEFTAFNWQIGAKNEKKFANDIKNTLSLAFDWYYFKRPSISLGSTTGQATIIGDIWNGVSLVGDPIYAGPLRGEAYPSENGYAFTVADRAEFGKFSIYGALQYKDTERKTAEGTSFSKDSVNPTFALAYKPSDKVSVYGSYAVSYTRPVEVDVTYVNAGEIFAPIKTKQAEVGVKYEQAGLLHSLAFFDLNQGNYITEDAGNGQYYYSQQGENRYKGIEYYVTGKIAPKWNIMGGIMYLNGKREKLSSDDAHLEGRYATGAPKWNAVIAAEYEANESNSVIFRMNYVGESHVNDNGVKTPDYATVDLGYRHRTKLSGIPVTINAMCYNVLGKDYWISRGTSVALGAPRSFIISASFDLF